MAESPRIEELRRRVHSDPASIAFAALAEEYRRAGRFDEAIDTCTTGLQRHPAYLSARVTLGRALLEVARYEEAQQELEHVLKLAPENLAAIRGLTEIQQRRGDGLPGGAPADVTSKAPPRGEAVISSRAVLDLPLNPPPAVPLPATDIRPAPDLPDGAPPSDGPAAGSTADSEALVGLEGFLAAILQAKADRSASR